MEQNVSFITRMKQSLKKTVSFTALTAFLGIGALVASAAGNQVVFNGISGQDFPNLQVAKSGGTWGPSVSGIKAGDTINLFLWDHNSGNTGTAAAQNVTMKVNVPSDYNTSHTVTSVLDADNAAPVYGSVDISSLPENTKLSYVAGSAKFYRNVNDQLTEVNFPTGVNKDTIVTTGINLGSQEACWHYAQAVTLQLRVEGGTPDVTADKAVALTGGSSFSTSTDAQPGDAVEFRVHVVNNGTATAVAPQVIDTLDSKLTYVPGSSSIRAKVNNQDVDQAIPDSQIKIEGQKMTWTFGDMAPNASSAFYLHFQARVKEAGNFVVGTTVLPNCAKVTYNSTKSVDTNCVQVKVTREEDKVVNFNIVKRVSKVPGNGQLYQNVGTTPGEVVLFSLKITNTGNTPATNVTIKDILPSGLTYDSGATIYTQDNPNGVAINGTTLTGAGYVIPTLKNGTINMQEIRFKAKVTSSCMNGTLTNVAKVFYGGVEKAKDQASVDVACNPGLNIIKDIKNPTTNEFVDVLPGYVREGQTLTYRIKVQNTGNVTAVHPVLRDVLPAQVTYVQNSLTIDGISVNQAGQAGFLANNGILLTDFTPGMSKVIMFQVTVDQCPELGDTPIVNTAYVKADGIAEISDTAKATIKVVKPTLTF